jgi:dipeptidyl aminopeptidase/acylaminoacyl peptidase
LGYGGSSKESENIFETRFQTYTTVLTLLKSINRTNLPQWDGKNILIWAHSNGGQIALTTLEITGEDYPTVLWAPVTKPFPYSILYYTDESEDEGKFIRKELAKFEEDYDTDKYSITNYLDRINAPIEYHIGTKDDAIPLEWGTSFVKKMKSLEKTVRYYNHSGADHNMNPLWSDVIQKTLEFFNDSLEV